MRYNSVAVVLRTHTRVRTYTTKNGIKRDACAHFGCRRRRRGERAIVVVVVVVVVVFAPDRVVLDHGEARVP